MENNKIISYRENIFRNFIRRILKFFRKKGPALEVAMESDENDINSIKQVEEEKENFKEQIISEDSLAKQRILALKMKYDNNEISEQDISEEDMDELIKLYNEETERLNKDTEIRKQHIAQMLKELKCT